MQVIGVVGKQLGELLWRNPRLEFVNVKRRDQVWMRRRILTSLDEGGDGALSHVAPFGQKLRVRR